MTEPTYTRAEVARAVEILNGRRQAEQNQDTWDFWGRALPRPWGPGIAAEVAAHDGVAPQPTPEDVSGMSMTDYVRNRDRLGVTESNGILGTELRPWQQTTSTRESTQ